MPQDVERSAFDWEARFQENQTPWERTGLHPAFEDWQATDAFRDVYSVIIPGCGRSPELLRLVELGKFVIGADISHTAIAWQRERLDKRNLVASLYETDVLGWRSDKGLDAVYEQTFLCAIPPRLRADYETAVHDWLRPGGKLFALFMQKEDRGGPPYGCSLPAMHELFPEHRWSWPEDAPAPYPHPSLDGKAELATILTRR